MNEQNASLVEQGYDVVYASWLQAKTLHQIWRDQVIGQDYPEGFEHISFATPVELQRLIEALELSRDDQLVDLACGAGGSGLWVANATKTKLTGVDISAVGLGLAERRRDALGLIERAQFTKGSFSETGLEDGAAAGAMSLDALQYAPNKAEAMREAFRILKPGGRVAFYAFVLDPERCAAIPGAWEDPVEDYRAPIAAAGFDVLAYETTDRWLDRLTDAYAAVIAARSRLIAEIGERATNTLLFEMTLTLEHRPYRDRVFAVARKP